LIESRLGFSIRNPSGSPLVRKSAKADPRFVVSVSYGDNVRALGRMQDGLAEDRLLLDGTSEADDTETIPLSSSRNSLKGQSSDGIELFDDGIDNNNQPVLDTSGMAFTQTVSDSAGIKTWTLRPPKDQNIVLNSQQTLRWVFNGICPDDNIGDAMVTIAYYDISGYKDGYLIIDPQKVRPRPFLIAPSKPAEVVFKSPNAGIKPSWQFFGVDQISIRHQHGNKEIHRIADLPAIATYTINGKDRNLWQDHQLVAEMDAGDGGTISCLIANVKCEVPFSLDMRNKVYRSDWFQLQKRPRMIKEIQECQFWRDPQERKLFRLNREARRMREGEYCRFSVWYEGEDWILSLEIWDPHFQTPSEYKATIRAEFPTMPPRLERILERLGRNEPRVGGGFFPLEEISYPGHEGVATFKVKINHQATKDGKTSQLFATSIEGRCWISSGDLIFDDSFFKKLTFNPDCGATPFDDYCLFASEPYPSATPLPAGVERPQPLPNYNGTESKHNDFDVYDTKQNAVSVSLQIYGGYDGSPTGTLSLMPGYDSQRPQSHVLGSRSLEPQDFHDQILQAHDFHEADLDQANFDQADLQGANLRRASLREASLQRAKLVMVNGSRASLRESNLEAALLNYANFEQATFEAANLSGASFLGANLTEAIFSGANLTEANFDGAIVEGAVFDTGCGLSAEQLEALRQRGAKVLVSPEPRYTPDDLDPASDPEAIP
jgi:uncharacterized protein YjbI with pentapeptide repeats